MNEPSSALTSQVAEMYRNALMAAMRDIFTTMLGERIARIQGRTTEAPHVSALVGLAGEFSGVITLHFSEASACKIASGLLGTKLEQLDETVRDSIAELANMVAGGFKKTLSPDRELFKVSIPSVIQGLQYNTRGSTNSEQIWIGAGTDSYQFDVQLIVEAKKTTKQR